MDHGNREHCLCEECLAGRRERWERALIEQKVVEHLKTLEGSEVTKLREENTTLRALLRECLQELSTIEAITVSPSDTDGLLDLVRRVTIALESPSP